ncbi:glycosyltransferase [Halorhodospira neutriphila]|uniref:Glycosyl transferase, group 1 n=1 Tax=Halorhodospira neutriphila TaxID=168379 RepID=A0ABS1E2D7_9GAMM|nr:glycosyltransferase [Halorhodospira neutriphila]MBK1725630.1 hypothetical protein [Halorhodospira neutriphila]
MSSKIAIFGSFNPQGGIQRRLANVIKVWVSWGIEVEIISYRSGSLFYPDELSGRVSFVDLGTYGKVSTSCRLWQHLKRTSPAAVLSTMHTANVILARLPGSSLNGTRRILSVPNSFGESEKRPPKKKAKKLKQVRRLYPRADGIVAISSGVERSLVETIGLKEVPIRCIFNGSVTNENMRRARAEPDHPWFKDGKEAEVVLTVGRLARQKDQHRLIDAVASLREERDVKLVIVGEGPLKQDLIERASQYEDSGEWLSMPGFLSNPYALMARSDCFVLCSLWEGFPNVLAEALGVGARVVATDCPSGARDILDGGRYGHLIPVGDTQALRYAIKRVLDGDYPSYDVTEAVSRFTDEYVARQYLEVFGIDRG